ncbi:MAG: thermonuclease family protein [Cyanobacteria bacterium P01_A01_bin.83]
MANKLFESINLIKLLFTLCFILLISCSAQPDRENLLAAKVTRVVSGQTVEVRLTGATEVTKVRITGIDAPDLRQDPWGKEAKSKLSELVLGLPVLIESELDRDRFNRINGHLWQGQTLISQQLVKSGCVLANDGYAHRYSKLLMESQEYARLMGYGIWNPQQAMGETPSQFRLKNNQ